MKIVIAIFIFMLSFSVTPLYAQQLQSLGNASGSVFVTANPSRPRPHQTVTVTIESYAMDLDRSTISWYLNSTLKQEALGKKTFTFQTGLLGSVSSILIVIEPPSGAPVQETLVIHPATVDLESRRDNQAVQ
ncbi:MAG: hypothetical protein NUV54_03175 [Candidatus Taylorbacteria bacterium]|nr:hypothetical protein [Candidatus Taylorbacteria bacterium]